MSFLREDLFRVAKQAGWVPGTPLSQHALGLRQAIITALRSAVQSDPSHLEDAPRLRYTDRGQEKHRRMTLADAMDAIREELDASPAEAQ